MVVRAVDTSRYGIHPVPEVEVHFCGGCGLDIPKYGRTSNHIRIPVDIDSYRRVWYHNYDCRAVIVNTYATLGFIILNHNNKRIIK